MASRLILDDYPWDKIKKTKEFIRGLFSGAPPDRPAAIIHPGVVEDEETSSPPPNLSIYQREAWLKVATLRRRPIGGDDFVPCLDTNIHTCALATAFGAEEEERSGVTWVKPCLRSNYDIDHLQKPRICAGRLGEVLERTRAYARYVDERLPVRVMDFQSPFTTVEQLLGSERFFVLPYDDPERLKNLMEIVTDFSIEFFQAQIGAAGQSVCPGVWPPIWLPECVGIQMSDDNLVNVSPDIYEEFVVPYNNRVACAFGGLFLHSCTIREKYLAVLKKLTFLTGLNCDISNSAPVSFFFDEFAGKIVFSPHAYTNTETNFESYAGFAQAILSAWSPGKRLFIYPCTVMYLPDRITEISFGAREMRKELEKIPEWKRDHPVTFSTVRPMHH